MLFKSVFVLIVTFVLRLVFCDFLVENGKVGMTNEEVYVEFELRRDMDGSLDEFLCILENFLGQLVFLLNH